jgi:hypothetical protein
VGKVFNEKREKIWGRVSPILLYNSSTEGLALTTVHRCDLNMGWRIGKDEVLLSLECFINRGIS